MNTPSPTDIETLLRSFSPEPLTANRDQLFFQAGYAAGAKTRGVRLFWPSAAAALFVACIGLGIVAGRQTAALHTALAAVQRAENLQLATNSAAKPPAPPIAQAFQPDTNDEKAPDANFAPSILDNNRLRSWQQLATANFRTHGRLTARGWVESPDDFREPQESTDESPTPRPRPSTYLELRQLHLEG